MQIALCRPEVKAICEKLRFETTVSEYWLTEREDTGKTPPSITGQSSNKLLNGNFTLENFLGVFAMREFEAILLATFTYTVLGTAGAIVVGLFAAQLLSLSFPGRVIFRGLFLFPYVAPVIAMAFTWLVLLDPNSGALNALLLQMGALETPINFFGIRWTEVELFGLDLPIPLALLMVIAFEVWRYFPLSFLFILARMQSVPQDMFEAAEMDGATPFQKFRELWLPQLAGILAVLFLLRFIWTFNKFDDIFLLTGGAAGTRTLTVSVYEQAFAAGLRMRPDNWMLGQLVPLRRRFNVHGNALLVIIRVVAGGSVVPFRAVQGDHPVQHVLHDV